MSESSNPGMDKLAAFARGGIPILASLVAFKLTRRHDHLSREELVAEIDAMALEAAKALGPQVIDDIKARAAELGVRPEHLR
jgi:hypothetical protein